MTKRLAAPPPTIAERIREARLAKGLTQEQLAQILHVSSITLSRWERGKFPPDSKHRERLQRVLGIAPEEPAA